MRIVSSFSSDPLPSPATTEQRQRKLENFAGYGIVNPMPAARSLTKHSIRIAGHATSLALEIEFWEALAEIAAHRGVALATLLAAIDAERSGNLASAVRLFVLASCRRGELGGAARSQ